MVMKFFRPHNSRAGIARVSTIAKPEKMAPATKYGGKIVVCQPGSCETAKSKDTTEWTEEEVGAAVVTVNAQLLGGNLSFFQSVCVLGYCIFPLTISALLTFAWSNFVWKALVVAVGFMWATRASVLFMSSLVPDRRQALAAFPVFLFYTVLAWMILIG